MTELFAVIGITLLAVISPGPDFAMVSRNSLLLSRRAGVLTAIGIGTALFYDPLIAPKITAGMRTYLQMHGMANISHLVGSLRLSPP